MSVVVKPDPIGVDASHLLEGQNSTEGSVESTTPVPMPTAPFQHMSNVIVPMPLAPNQPPGSVVGGSGLPKLSTIWNAPSPCISIIQSVEFTVLQNRMECYLRFMVLQRPISLTAFITQEEWNDLRDKVDTIGRRIRWDANRSLILLVVLFVIVVVVNMGDEIGGGFVLGDYQMSIVIFLSVILVKLLWDECYQNYTRRAVLHEMDVVCREYSDLMRPRGACVAFRFVDNDDLGLLVDLTFYRAQTTEDVLLNIP